MIDVVITAGGTSEKIDNVRKITNSGSGKLGATIAMQLYYNNPEVQIHYIHSRKAELPELYTSSAHSGRVHYYPVEDVADLVTVTKRVLTEYKIDYFIHTMAVSDYTLDYCTTMSKLEESFKSTGDSKEVEKLSGNKLSSYENNLVVVLKPTPKVISMIHELSPETCLVGFKLLDGVSIDELIDVATKLRDKNNCSFVVANDLSSIRNGEHIAYIIDRDSNINVVKGKGEIAKALVKVLEL